MVFVACSGADGGVESNGWMSSDLILPDPAAIFIVILTRGQFLTVGPLALVALCYGLAAPGPSSSSHQRVPYAVHTYGAATGDSRHLTDACRSCANDLRSRLAADWSVLVREPFVIGGDCEAVRLEDTYRETIRPTARALGVQFFDHSPDWPVTILLCSSDESYRECLLRLDDRDRSEYSGIYSRDDHRVVVNVATGDGTLAHELTHALAHADFPALPEWIDEGLASLHEECEFSADGLRLQGLDNWRRSVLLEAIGADRLRSVSGLAEERFAISERAAVDYAHARYFFLFLQQRRLLEPFYRKCRSNAETDATGLDSLCELFDARSPAEIDEAFRDWLTESVSTRKP